MDGHSVNQYCLLLASAVNIGLGLRPQPILLLRPLKDNIGLLTIHCLYNMCLQFTTRILVFSECDTVCQEKRRELLTIRYLYKHMLNIKKEFSRQLSHFKLSEIHLQNIFHNYYSFIFQFITCMNN